MKDKRGRTSPYDPKTTEARWYEYWESKGFFRADRLSGHPPHTIMMPPPNVTGALHMGHALQDTVQDALTRMRRMQGREALWMPGKDHAGIATQNVVERALKEEEKKSRFDLGREAFIEKVWEWVDEYGDRILQQKRRLGDSCDWERERFTMDPGYVKAVQTVFVKLYEAGLIYRGHYLVNWCPKDRTALSDEEVDNVERDGFLWHIRYPLADGSGHITVATTRPETMLGDVAVAVNPKDERYTDLVNKQVELPLTGRNIPVIADHYVQQEFGTGVLKITPGHDKNDFEVGKRHELEIFSVIAEDGTLTEECGPYAGIDRFEARERIVKDLEAGGLLGKIEPYKSTVPISQRSKAVVEPLLSRQWFVKMKPLAEPAITAVRDGTIKFYPRRWENEYFRWLEGIRDWCISRQLWWGHRIPVWYYTDSRGEVDEAQGFVVSIEQPEPGMVQEEDVLDTWFSSWLFPFATLGWPEEDPETQADLEYFHPTDVLVSGYDILFFWIARMIMASLYFTGQVPYRDIFITGMIKDKLGRWMSKSLGNGIDPLELIEEYGADAVRFYLTILCAQGQDIRLDPAGFQMGRNFSNKIWNAFNVFGRFIEPKKEYRRTRSIEELELVERWMLTRLAECIESVEGALVRYRLNEAANLLYTTFRSDYCDWYLELVKPQSGSTLSEESIALAIEIYEQLIQLLHPFMPFITEELWHRLRPRAEGEACMVSRWPVANDERDTVGAEQFTFLQEAVTSIRHLRSRYGVAPGKKIEVTLSVSEEQSGLTEVMIAHTEYFAKLARVERLHVGVDLPKPPQSTSTVVGSAVVYVQGMVDPAEERERLTKDLSQKEGFLFRVQKKLQNEKFISRAPAKVVELERQKEADAKAEIKKLRDSLAAWSET
ncbi:MAG: valine--tRNA ligase [Rhodothermaceae bacterium]|nr:valine--tRNA ligase [Rhodothermaceae bacterium]MXZ57967.1 valine--tRNA ligase [Rhodothermaceae bacterium]MYB90956.1 valine--tRNA ligase [Rhodothermaceae bacterium]MYD67659.1 valine--tRNA ligase [Rhodothermaceae bacterium]MYG44546.1 valine--tRNA ligase [Rhodothermaceae bacterium]